MSLPSFLLSILALINVSLPSFDFDDLKWKLPFGCIVSGPSGSGKTSFLRKLLDHVDKLITPTPASILYCYGSYHKFIPSLERSGVVCCSGIPSDELIAKLPRPLLIIFDDLMGCVSEKYITEMFVKRAHHEGFGMIFLLQNLFSRELRVSRFNSQYLILMRQPNSMQNVRNIAQQLFPGNMKYFMAAFSDATAEPFGYLMVDLHAASNQLLRLRSKIFPDNTDKTIYLPSNV